MSEANEAARQMARAAAEPKPGSITQEQADKIMHPGPKTLAAVAAMTDIQNRAAAYLPPGTIARTSESKSAHDKVLDFIADQNLNFLLGRAVEAICVTDIRSDYYYLEDLKKAQNYIEREIKRITDNAAHH